MPTSIEYFSRFVSDLNDRAQTEGVEELADWAVRNLADTLGFDCAWYGWANLDNDSVEICASSTLNLPSDYLHTWEEIAAQDMLAKKVLELPEKTATHSRNGKNQNDGTVHLMDSYGFSKMAVALNHRPGHHSSFYLSSYRSGKTAREWSSSERSFPKCAVDHLSVRGNGQNTFFSNLPKLQKQPEQGMPL